MSPQKFNNVAELQYWHDRAANSARRTSEGCLLLGVKMSYSYQEREKAPGVLVSAYAHQVALMLYLRACNIPKGTEASHLCGNKGCIEPTHFRPEPHWVNQRRTKCHGRKRSRKGRVCYGHAGFTKCLCESITSLYSCVQNELLTVSFVQFVSVCLSTVSRLPFSCFSV